MILTLNNIFRNSPFYFTTWQYPFMPEKKKKELISRLKSKYRLVIMNDDTFEEVIKFRLSRLSVYMAFSTIFLVMIGLAIALLVLTPLKYYIPGYDDLKLGREYKQMKYRVDSLEKQVTHCKLSCQHNKKHIKCNPNFSSWRAIFKLA